MFKVFKNTKFNLPDFKVVKIMSIGMRVPNPRMSDPDGVYPRLSGGVNV